MTSRRQTIAGLFMIGLVRQPGEIGAGPLDINVAHRQSPCNTNPAQWYGALHRGSLRNASCARRKAAAGVKCRSSIAAESSCIHFAVALSGTVHRLATTRGA